MDEGKPLPAVGADSLTPAAGGTQFPYWLHVRNTVRVYLPAVGVGSGFRI